jgi:predicted phosphatase
MSGNSDLHFFAVSALSISTALAAVSWPDRAASSPINATLAFQLSQAFTLAQAQPAPTTESILRKTIKDLQQGTPDFDSMDPALQQAVKDQSQSMADIYRHLGALKTLKYIGVHNGLDIYRATYENAAVTYTIRMSPSGKIDALLLQPAFPWE